MPSIVEAVAKGIMDEQRKYSLSNSEVDLPQNEIFKYLAQGERGLTKLLVQAGKDKFVSDSASKKWYFWDDNSWSEDRTQSVYRMLPEILVKSLRKLDKQISGIENKEDKKTKEEVLKTALKKLDNIDSANRLVNAAAKGHYCPNKESSDTVEGLGLEGDEWDRHPYLIGFPNGVLDMRTGGFRLGQPQDFIKDTIPFEWRGWEEQAPTFSKFLESVLPKDPNKPELGGDKEVIACLQRCLGHSFRGCIKEHKLVILAGEKGRNGKTTLMEAIKSSLGDGYVYAANSGLLTEQSFTRSSSAPSPDKMALRNKRIVYASEVKRGATMDCEQVKHLTGGDSITARNCFDRHDVTFEPTQQLVLIANDIPQIAYDDAAMWYRLLIFKFQLSFVDDPKESYERKADPELLEKLKKETSGIITWVLKGCMEYKRQGINPPESVKASVREFQIKNDVLGLFISEALIKDQNASIAASALYAAYKRWALDSGFPQKDIMTSTSFGTKIKERIARDKAKGSMVYKGYRLPKQTK